jgi:hypothetical protein
MYNPDILVRHHGKGSHQYLIAREAIEADVVINLPKLKTHKKACLTGALKNLVGINGHKEYLPHHRKGGSMSGGDCYRGRSFLKRASEECLDLANRTSRRASVRLLAKASELLARLSARLGDDDNLEGAWYGNDTIWRTCLDLQRVLRYGRPDGTLAEEPQRTVIHITDAIIAGEGDGPLAPDPVPAGVLTGALNPAAADLVHARLMGFDYRKIPIVSNAFGRFSMPIAAFDPGEVRVREGGSDLELGRLPAPVAAFRPPAGWKGHCEA